MNNIQVTILSEDRQTGKTTQLVAMLKGYAAQEIDAVLYVPTLDMARNLIERHNLHPTLVLPWVYSQVVDKPMPDIVLLDDIRLFKTQAHPLRVDPVHLLRTRMAAKQHTRPCRIFGYL